MPPFLLLLVWLFAAPGALALESPPTASPRATATLVTDSDAITAGTPVRIALRLRLAPGWHTYWRNPGDAGAAPELTLSLPEGAQPGPIIWAAPERIPEGPLMTYGYTGDVLLPVTVTPGGGPLDVTAEASWLVCKEICVPEEARFTLTLPRGPPTPSAEAALFARHDATVPRSVPWKASISPDGQLRIEAEEIGPRTVRQAWFVPDEPGLIRDAGEQALRVEAGALTLALPLIRTVPPTAMVSGVLILRDPGDGRTAFAIRASPGPAAEPAVPIAAAIGLAVLAGLILNLMPCVFPILAMKAMALAHGAAGGRLRAHAVSYTLGVLVTFTALGGALLAARASGSAAGWGFQFQAPAFVAAMTWLLFAVGLNLSGVFPVGGAMAGAGSNLAARRGHLGSFFTGLLAVLVATPCTAPFMGVAIAAGLAAPPAVTILVFLALGIGLAAPYALLAALPALGRLTPRPGPWMERLRQVLAFPMYGSAAWLLWVLSQSAGPDGVLAGASGLVVLGFGLWAFGTTRPGGRGARRIGSALLIACVAGAAMLASGLRESPAAEGAAADAWSAGRLDQLRAEGRPVFVNMTAAWCVTCLVNERVALGTTAVRAAFAERGITYLKGDWTRQDAAITAFLRSFGRDGVPLYVYYPPAGAPPVILPQLLTEATVLEALRH